MKKTFRIRIAIITIIVISILSFCVYKFIQNDSKKYEIAKVNEYNYFLLKQNNLYGVIDKKGNTIINVQYDDIKIPNPEKAIFICYKGKDTKVLNAEKQDILTQYEKVEPIRLKNIASDLMYEKSVLKYHENGKYGLINFEGKKITKAIYNEIDSLPYKEGELIVKQDEKYGVINIKGTELVNIEYDQISVDGYYTEENQYKYAGYIVSNKTNEGYRYGYIDYNGEILEEIQYNELSRVTDIEDNENVYILCAKNGQYGITKNGKELIQNEYQSINFSKINNLFLVEKSKKYGITDLNGKIIVPVEYKQIDTLGIYLYANNEQGTTVYNSEGNQVNIDANIGILDTANDKYRIRINTEENAKYGVIGKDGKQIIEEKYNYIEYLYDNYFIVSNENSKLGIIDDKDNIKVEIINDSVQKIKDTNIIQTTIGQTTQLFSKEMKKVCEMENAIIEEKEDYIKIYNSKQTKYFNQDGKEVKNTEVYKNNTLYAEENDGNWGFSDINGNMKIGYRYEKVTEFNEYGFAAVKLNGKWGAIDEQGKEVSGLVYEFKEDVIPSFIGKYYKVTYGFGEFYFTDQT